MHILFVRFSSMGDVVLQTATLNWLRSLYGEEATFSFVTSSEFAPLIENHPELNHVISFDRRKGETWNTLKRKIKELHQDNPIDLILDLHATLRSFRLKLSFWTIPSLTVDKRRWERFLLTKIKNVKLKRLFHRKIFGLEPQVERILNDFESIFHDHRAKRRTIDFRKGSHQELTSLGEVHSAVSLISPYIVLAPSASFEPKRWPISSFVALAEKIIDDGRFHVAILAGSQDDFCEAFNKIHSNRLVNLQGKTSLKESMSVLKGAKLCVGNDSGMNHIAEAYGVPCLTLFGPTDPRFGFAPHGANSTYISKELYCKPCSTTGKTPCYRERLFCMEDISVSEVYEQLFQMLRKA
jgi:ADP-heptose:LPS heptosyltransferase